jgi:hypothetical protein
MLSLRRCKLRRCKIPSNLFESISF